MTYALGRLETMYVVGLPKTRLLRRVAGRSAAVTLAEQLARAYRRRSHIHAYGPQGRKGKLLAIVAPSGVMELHGALYGVGCGCSTGMGDTLTDWACDQAAHNSSWRERVNQGINTGAQAALIGGLAAGLLGSLIKRPVLGTVIGGVTGWAAHAIWTAPLAP